MSVAQQDVAANPTVAPDNGAPPEPERRVLTADQIRQAPPDCVEELFEVPEWGGWVKLRSPTALAAADIKSASLRFDADGQTVGMDVAAMERAQVRHGVVDPALSEDDVEHMQKTFGPSFNRLVEALDRIGGPLGKAALGEAAVLKEAEHTFRPRAN